MAALNRAVGAWNAAATPVMADMNDPALSIEGFGSRTKAGRAAMREALAEMKAAIPSDIEPTLLAVLKELVGSYEDKMAGLDGVAKSIADSDLTAMDAALARWQRGIDRQAAAMRPLLAAASPYLSAQEMAAWEQVIP